MNYIILFLFAALGCSCALAEWIAPGITEVVSDPAVQEAASGVVSNVISGNWIGAIANLGELIAVGGATWTGVNMSRDRKRKKRGEPTGATAHP